MIYSSYFDDKDNYQWIPWIARPQEWARYQGPKNYEDMVGIVKRLNYSNEIVIKQSG